MEITVVVWQGSISAATRSPEWKRVGLEVEDAGFLLNVGENNLEELVSLLTALLPPPHVQPLQKTHFSLLVDAQTPQGLCALILAWLKAPAPDPLRLNTKLCVVGFVIVGVGWQHVLFTDSTFVFAACDCNGRSQECYFDPELYRSTGHGGHCTGCSDNTDGAHCERCRDSFYRLGSEGGCLPCSCNPVGKQQQQMFLLASLHPQKLIANYRV